MFLAGVGVPWELVEWLQWIVGGRTGDLLSEALYIHSPVVVLTTRDEEAILKTIESADVPPEGLGELQDVLRARHSARMNPRPP
jgi:hypothetical protein